MQVLARLRNLFPLVLLISRNLLHLQKKMHRCTAAPHLPNPALTAASPNTKAPKILNEVPRLFGVLASPSYNSSNVNKRINASIIIGKGTLLLCIEKFINKFTGRISGSYEITAINKAGVIIAKMNARSLITLIKVEKKGLW